MGVGVAAGVGVETGVGVARGVGVGAAVGRATATAVGRGAAVTGGVAPATEVVDDAGDRTAGAVAGVVPTVGAAVRMAAGAGVTGCVWAVGVAPATDGRTALGAGATAVDVGDPGGVAVPGAAGVDTWVAGGVVGSAEAGAIGVGVVGGSGTPSPHAAARAAAATPIEARSTARRELRRCATAVRTWAASPCRRPSNVRRLMVGGSVKSDRSHKLVRRNQRDPTAGSDGDSNRRPFARSCSVSR